MAFGVPAVTTPVWAIPLVRANRRLRRVTNELTFLANTDPLCGILNRRAFFVKTSVFCRKADRDGSPVAVMMVDLDRFKSVNDIHGHDAGDFTIRAVAAAIGSVIRERCPEAAFSRLGGDEFAVAAVGVMHVEAGMIAEEMCERVRRLVVFEGRSMTPTTISIGVAVRRRRQSIGDALKTADEALYQAKEKGRDRPFVVAFTAIPALPMQESFRITERSPRSRVA